MNSFKEEKYFIELLRRVVSGEDLILDFAFDTSELHHRVEVLYLNFSKKLQNFDIFRSSMIQIIKSNFNTENEFEAKISYFAVYTLRYLGTDKYTNELIVFLNTNILNFGISNKYFYERNLSFHLLEILLPLDTNSVLLDTCLNFRENICDHLYNRVVSRRLVEINQAADVVQFHYSQLEYAIRNNLAIGFVADSLQDYHFYNSQFTKTIDLLLLCHGKKFSDFINMLCEYEVDNYDEVRSKFYSYSDYIFLLSVLFQFCNFEDEKVEDNNLVDRIITENCIDSIDINVEEPEYFASKIIEYKLYVHSKIATNFLNHREFSVELTNQIISIMSLEEMEIGRNDLRKKFEEIFSNKSDEL